MKGPPRGPAPTPAAAFAEARKIDNKVEGPMRRGRPSAWPLDVRPLHPSLHLGRTSRPLPTDAAAM